MIRTLTPEFVDSVPHDTVDGVIYISIRYAVAIHRCCCGCGREVVSRLSPDGWAFTFDGESISLNHSIGNSEFECRSHYWIRENAVEWLPDLSSHQVALLERKDPLDRGAQSDSYADGSRQGSGVGFLTRAKNRIRRLLGGAGGRSVG